MKKEYCIATVLPEEDQSDFLDALNSGWKIHRADAVGNYIIYVLEKYVWN